MCSGCIEIPALTWKAEKSHILYFFVTLGLVFLHASESAHTMPHCSTWSPTFLCKQLKKEILKIVFVLSKIINTKKPLGSVFYQFDQICQYHPSDEGLVQMFSETGTSTW